jgi:hypothetical protein
MLQYTALLLNITQENSPRKLPLLEDSQMSFTVMEYLIEDE